VRSDGRHPDRASVGPVRSAAMTTETTAPAAAPIGVAREGNWVRRIPWTLIVFLVLATVPWVGSRYDTFLAEQIAIDALFAVSLNLLLGTTGLLPCGHRAQCRVRAGGVGCRRNS